MSGILLVALAAFLAWRFFCTRACADQEDCEDYRRLLDNLDGCVSVLQCDTGELLYVNERVREEYGLSESPVGHFCWEIFKKGAEGVCADCPCQAEALRETGKGIRFVWESRSELTQKNYKNVGKLIAWKGVKACMLHSLDLASADSLKYEKDLHAALNSAQKANDAKNEFLSRISHEIRTPMNAIIGMTKIAKQSQDETKVRDCLEKIDVSSRHLKNIIDDILDVSQIESRQFKLANVPFNANKLLTRIERLIRAKTGEKRQNLTFHVEDTLHDAAYNGDSGRLSQLIVNLLSNAVKFTPQGGSISFSIGLKERIEDEVLLEILVEDSGVGISEENLRKIFSPFEQGDGSITRKFGGTGLGLVICKNIVKLMKGTIRIRSEEGKGTLVTATVRLAPSEFPPSDEEFGEPETSDLRFLLNGEDEEIASFQSFQEQDADGSLSLTELRPFIDVEQGLQNLKGNGKLYATLLRSYLKNDILDKIRQATASKNFEEARQKVHALRDIAANLAMGTLQNRAALLENSLRGKTFDTALLKKLDVSAQEIRRMLPKVIRDIEEGKFS